MGKVWIKSLGSQTHLPISKSFQEYLHFIAVDFDQDQAAIALLTLRLLIFLDGFISFFFLEVVCAYDGILRVGRTKFDATRWKIERDRLKMLD